MQNKGFVKVFAVLLALVCAFYLSFSFVANWHESKAQEIAAAQGEEAGQHYLEPDDRELEIISYLNDNFDDVILLINCNNTIELGWVEQYENISAIVNFPGGGRTGTYGLGYMLTGYDANGNEISPSGHLVDTWVYDNFSSPAMQNMGDFKFTGTKNDYYYVNYSEGIYVGYRYYETRYEDVVMKTEKVGSFVYEDAVKYPFGYGLSYTEFEYGDIKVSSKRIRNGKLTVKVPVTNIGKVSGSEVVQIYVHDCEASVDRPTKELKGFDKVYLEPGETKTVTIELGPDAFRFFDETTMGWKTEAGEFEILACSSSDNVRRSVKVAL